MGVLKEALRAGQIGTAFEEIDIEAIGLHAVNVGRIGAGTGVEGSTRRATEFVVAHDFISPCNIHVEGGAGKAGGPCGNGSGIPTCVGNVFGLPQFARKEPKGVVVIGFELGGVPHNTQMGHGRQCAFIYAVQAGGDDTGGNDGIDIVIGNGQEHLVVVVGAFNG